MKKFLFRAAPVGLLALVLMQFWRPARNAATTPGPNDINLKYPVPAAVQAVLQTACYDCHSNHTHYPWYANMQPVRWWLDSHINDGKRHLDFSEFSAYSTKRKADVLGKITDEVLDHTMPLKSYTWIHADARLTPAEIKLIADWADDLHDRIDPP
jgi:hypothetical protein